MPLIMRCVGADCCKVNLQLSIDSSRLQYSILHIPEATVWITLVPCTIARDTNIAIVSYMHSDYEQECVDSHNTIYMQCHDGIQIF